MRHIGAKERFIRDLYKTGNMAKRDKEQQAQEMARIDAVSIKGFEKETQRFSSDGQAAQVAHAQDTGIAGPSRQSVLYTLNHASPASSAPKRPAKSVDKFANYSTAAQLGLVEEETAPSSYEVEQMVRNRETKVGQWEEVVDEPTGLHSAQGSAPQEEDEEGEGWKFQHKGKRPVRDPYDDDDFDPRAVLKMRKKVKSEGQPDPAPTSAAAVPTEKPDLKGGLDRNSWNGTIDLSGRLSSTKKDGLVFQAGGGWVKPEDEKGVPHTVGAPGAADETSNTEALHDAKPRALSDKSISTTSPEAKPVIPDKEPVDHVAVPVSDTASAETGSGGLFKKRRPPPSSRKK